jgi:hypothetical protein
MPRTTRLTHALRGRGKTVAAGLGLAAVLAGAGSASAALTSSPAPATQPAPAHAAELTAQVSPATLTPARSTPARSTPAPAAPAAAHPAALTAVQPAPAPARPATTTPAAQPAPARPATTPARPATTPAQPAPAQAAPQAAPAPAQPAAAQTQQPVTQPASQPYQIYDSTTPSAIPAGQQAAVYSNGAYATTPAQVAGHPNTIWIDTNGSNPSANALDVEPGDATPAQAGQWVAQKLTSTPSQIAIVYTMRSDWPAVQAAVGQLPQWMQNHVRWWIADPTGIPHMVPGASATQWYWGPSYDISTANPGF